VLLAEASSRKELTSLETALHRGASFLVSLQRLDGHWPGDYGGPLFLLPGLLIACAVTGAPLSDERRASMLRYLRHVQNADGGFGLHIESESYVLGTVLNYVAMRLAGAPAEDPDATRARRWLRDRGGARGVPTWGKIWLSVLGCYDWEGVMPIPPELWLLPRSMPIHPGKLWCHTRAIHLPVSYLYGKRFVGPISETVRELRTELFVEPYGSIDWVNAREFVHPGDVSSPHSALLKTINRALAAAERRVPQALRKRALEFVADQIQHEDETTGYLDIGPVSKAFHIVCAHVAAPGSARFQRHLERIEDYLWDAPEGTKMQGYNGSQFWDTAFAVHALVESGLEQVHAVALNRAHAFIDQNQVRADIERHDFYFRDRTGGAFPFSTAEQGWTVSDCTAKGITASLLLTPLVERPLGEARLGQAVDVLLRDQNKDGGWSEYEPARAGEWVEQLNAAEVFGRIMVAYSYVETTSACIQALAAFRRNYPANRTHEIQSAVRRGLAYLHEQQRPDGSFYGGWGVCFTYATWFGIEGLLAAGESAESLAVVRAVQFLLEQQAEDGGFGESYKSCVERRWVPHPDGSQVVQTAWALLGLSAVRPKLRTSTFADHIDRASERGAHFLRSRQLANGDWPNEGITGVFNKTCMIHYDNYRRVMPVWALGRYLATKRSSSASHPGG
jgi:squalene/oxidosqualene cyclase-like protein